jgi:hypothetical protein
LTAANRAHGGALLFTGRGAIYPVEMAIAKAAIIPIATLMFITYPFPGIRIKAEVKPHCFKSAS